ncbi:TPA_asm: maturation protein [ssRNA phage SRR7976299_14]|uniref:Maturation protein n=1 Tax=ssRNA phage SRR7976299_14 TaxID=2786636 RepID=A0A8S5L0S4_9VIRU|nr:maturation protein [ssRNA phage SRR7976299_14]DAD51067.1 TPA_asm: maturation protein [ssRNA phage SRR7976299_14]
MTQRTFKSPFPRYRERGSTSIGNAGNQVITSCDGTDLTPDYTNMLAHRSGEIEGCYDIVTPGFRSLSAGGKVIVNPYWHVKQNFTGGGTGPIVQFAGCAGLPGLTRKTVEYPSSRRHFLPDFRYGEVRNALDNTLIPAPLTIVDLNRLQTLAQTSCMSNVDVGPSQALVAAAEANRTLQMVTRPLGQLDDYVAKQHAHVSKQYTKFLALTPKQKQKLIRDARRPGGLRDALSGQYLGWYYGMKPFAKDIENALQAYLREGFTPERETARGKASDTGTNIITDPPLTSGGTTKQRLKRTRVEEVDVRAGCLYSPTSNSYSKEFGVRLSDVPSSLWEMTTLSFLVDYYLNIGNVIKALEPRIGITYLGNWLTVRQTVTDRIEVIDTIYGGPTHVITRPGTEWAARVVVSTQRIPLSNPYSYVGFARNSLSDNLQRNVAIAALISQRVKAIGAVYGAFALATM